VPRIRLLPGERNRTFVLSAEQELKYLEAAPQPLKDIALLILETGLRVGEALALKWVDIRLEPTNGTRFGFLQIRDGKSRNAVRTVSLTERATEMLRGRAEGNREWVFTARSGYPYVGTSIAHIHAKVREEIELADDFVIHSLRHTMLSRLGEAGVDGFTIMRIAGHSSVTVSERYVHPANEALERAFERLEAANLKARTVTPKVPEVATVSATVIEMEAA
jgi:integrase